MTEEQAREIRDFVVDGNERSFPRWYTGPSTIDGQERMVVDGVVQGGAKTTLVVGALLLVTAISAGWFFFLP